VDDFEAQVAAAVAKMEADLAAAMYAAVDQVVKPRALELIPRETETAANSVQVFGPTPTAGGVEVVISFGRDDDSNPKSHTPSNSYIVPLHERMDIAHPGGGEAKFLENAVTEIAPAFGGEMQIRSTSGKGG
jgi:hypothetical protein